MNTKEVKKENVVSGDKDSKNQNQEFIPDNILKINNVINKAATKANDAYERLYSRFLEAMQHISLLDKKIKEKDILIESLNKDIAKLKETKNNTK